MLVKLLPILSILTPIAAIPFILAFGKKDRKYSGIISVISHLIVLIFTLMLYPSVAKGNISKWQLDLFLDPFHLSYRVDGIGYIVAITAILVWTISGIFSIRYLELGHNKRRYYSFSNLTLASCLGVAFAGDLFTFFLFFEAMSFISYALVAYEETSQSVVAANVYLFLGLIGSVALLFSIVYTYNLAGTVSLNALGILSSSTSKVTLIIIFISYIIGFGIKSGMFPFHVWLPDIYPVMPAPASTLFSCVMLKVGALGLIRVVYSVFGLDLVSLIGADKILLIFAAITIFWGSAVALSEYNLKRRLAYSSIGQMGYIMLGIALISPLGLAGALYHIFNHAIIKSALCLSIGGVYYKTHAKKVSDLDHMGTKMPISMSVFSLASFAIIGVPGLNGFISKWNLSLASLSASKPIFIVFLLLSSIMNALYYLPLFINSFFNTSTANPRVISTGSLSVAEKISQQEQAITAFSPLSEDEENTANVAAVSIKSDDKSKQQELPLSMLFCLVFLGSLIIIFGIFADIFPLNIIDTTIKIIFNSLGV